MAEREDVSRALVAGHSIRAIAAALGRAPSTISREIRRNGGAERYRASNADQAAWDRAHRPKTCKLALHPALAKRVADKLQQQWSPQQIAGWLKGLGFEAQVVNLEGRWSGAKKVRPNTYELWFGNAPLPALCGGKQAALPAAG